MKLYFAILFIVFFSLQSFSQTDLTLGLQAYYPFNGNANDASGNNNNPSFNNATLTTDRLGNSNSAYNFNGVDNYIRIPNSASLNPGTKVSVCAWVKAKGFFQGHCHGNMMVIKDDDAVSGSYMLMYSDGPYTSGAACNDALTVNETHENFYGFNTFPMGGYTPYVSVNQWQSVVWTYDGAKARLYVNCVRVDSVTVSMGSFSNSYDLFLGRINSQPYPWLKYWLNADLDEVRIYNRAINQAEVNLYGDCFTTPVLLNNFNLSATDKNNIGLTWTAENETGIKNYTIERSISNGENYLVVGTVAAKNTGVGQYSFTDNTVESGVDYYYRITVNEVSGVRKYSETKKITTAKRTDFYVSIYPNPSSGLFNLLINQSIGLTNITLINNAGQAVLKKKITSFNNRNIVPLNLTNIPRGAYWVKISSGNNVIVKKIIKR